MVSTIEKTYTVTHKCGHEVSMPRERQQKATIAKNIAFHETRVCKACFISGKKADSQKVLDAVLKMFDFPTLTEGSEKQINWANSLRNQLVPNAIMSMVDKYTFSFESGKEHEYDAAVDFIRGFNIELIQSTDAKDWIDLFTGKHHLVWCYFSVDQYDARTYTSQYAYYDSLEVSDSDKKKIQYYQPKRENIDDYLKALEQLSNTDGLGVSVYKV